MPEDPDDDASRADGTVLSPDDLDITDEDNVVEIDDGRYVISPGGREPNVPEQSTKAPGRSPTDTRDDAPSQTLSADVVHEWLNDRLEDADANYAFDVTARFEGSISQRAMFSNDVVATFENLVVWYAQHVASDTPVEDVLGILLLESNLSVRFPAESLRAFAVAHGLDDDDSIDTLVSAAADAGGVRFPPGDG